MVLAANAAHPLLLACVRGEPLKPSEPVDWPLLLSEARDHGLLTLLHESLAASGIAVPEFFHEAAVAEWASAHLRATRLESTLDALDGVTVMPLKGPMLAEALYGDAGLRSSNDLDLLVHERDVPRAEFLLLRGGFQAQEGDDDSYHHTFQRGDVTVELHFDLAPPDGLHFNVDDVWSRSIQAEFRSHPVRTMCSEDRAVYLCLHGLKHGFTRLMWIDDMSRSIRAVPAGELFRFAREQGLERPVAIGCQVVRATLGLPPEVEVELDRDPQQAASTQQAAQLLLAGAIPAIQGPGFVLLQMETGVRQRWRRRLGFFAPTSEDHRWADTHGVPRALTLVTRPFRLLAKHGFVRAWKIFFPK